MNRVVIVANEGKILTNGTIYGTKIYLGDGVEEADFHEITREEYERIMAEAEADDKETL